MNDVSCETDTNGNRVFSVGGLTPRSSLTQDFLRDFYDNGEPGFVDVATWLDSRKTEKHD